METVSFLADAGFRVLDFNFCAAIYTDPFTIDRTIVEPGWQHTIEALRNEMEKRQVVAKYSHLPFYRFDEPRDRRLGLQTRDDAPRHRSVRDARRAMGRGASLPLQGPGYSRSQHRCVSGNFTGEGNKARRGARGGKHAVPPTRPTTTPRPCVRSLTGSGKAWASAGTRDTPTSVRSITPQTVKQLGRRIKMLHVHDNGGIKDEHRPPFLRNIDW